MTKAGFKDVPVPRSQLPSRRPSDDTGRPQRLNRKPLASEADFACPSGAFCDDVTVGH